MVDQVIGKMCAWLGKEEDMKRNRMRKSEPWTINDKRHTRPAYTSFFYRHAVDKHTQAVIADISSTWLSMPSASDFVV